MRGYVMISPEDLIKIYQKYDKSRKHLIFIDRNYDDSYNEGYNYIMKMSPNEAGEHHYTDRKV